EIPSIGRHFRRVRAAARLPDLLIRLAVRDLCDLPSGDVEAAKLDRALDDVAAGAGGGVIVDVLSIGRDGGPRRARWGAADELRPAATGARIHPDATASCTAPVLATS